MAALPPPSLRGQGTGVPTSATGQYVAAAGGPAVIYIAGCLSAAAQPSAPDASAMGTAAAVHTGDYGHTDDGHNELDQ